MAQAAAEKLEHNGPAKKERVALVPQRKQLASTPEPPFPVIKKNRVVQRIRLRGGRESRWPNAAFWQVRGRSEREHEEERVEYTVKEERFQEGEGERARIIFLGEVEGSMSG